MSYELRLFDKVILKFNISQNEYKELEYSIIEFDKSKESLLPIGMSPDSDSLQSFLRHRVIPKNREFVEKILSNFGLTENDTMGIINICKGLSLNDSYWITEEGFEGTFAQYNLYDNNFTRTLALIAYTGYGSNSKKGFTSSPEFTTNGMLKKCWRRQNGVYLYKGGTFGFANTGLEPYSEFYAAQIAEIMGLNHIDYDIKKWKGTLCSTCKLFTSKDVSYVPIYRFVEKCSLATISKFLKDLGKDFYEKFCNMLIFDSLIINTDRHFGNFGLLVDSHTNKILDFAPIFDNGLSLFCYGMDSDFENLDNYLKQLNPPYPNIKYNDVIELYLSHCQKAKLRKLIGFKFKKHSRYNLPKNRLKKIEDFLQKRLDYMLNFETKN